MKTLLIYGATGYTGPMASENAKAAGISFVIAGRDESPPANLASELGVKYLVSSLNNVFVVLNCARPFRRTADPLMRAAITRDLAVNIHVLKGLEDARYRELIRNRSYTRCNHGDGWR
jgi:short subunit dehydrogenase-like uncharacterized protein